MPVYHVKDAKTGLELDLRGDSPPTDEELAQLFDSMAASRSPARARTWTDTAVDSLPTVGGMAGGIAGGVGGTVAGFGVGGAPGAIGGAALGGSLGEALRQLANRARGVEAPATPMEAAKGIGRQGAEQGALEAGGQVAMAALSRAGRAVYRGYLKPSLSDRLGPKAKEIVETGIREAIPVTEGGAARTEGLIADLQAQVQDILQNTKGDVNLHDVANRVRGFARRKYFMAGKPTADYEAAMKVADELDNHASMAPVPPNARVDTVDLPQADRIKRGLDETIGETNFGVERGATKTAQKVARFEMRRGIETAAPEVGPLNARESRLIDLADSVNKAVGREGNRNQLFGVPSLLSLGGGAESLARGASPFAAATMTLASRMGLSPAVATRAAIVAAQMGDKVPGTAVADVARVAVRVVSEAQDQPQGIPP